MTNFILDNFFNKIFILKNEFNIKLSNNRSSDKDSKRIAILVNDCYLECDGDLYWAGILERKVYEEIKRSNFICDPIPYELNWEEKRVKTKDRSGFDPLKLVFNKLDRYLGYHPIIVYLNNKIIKILSREERTENNGNIRKFKDSRLNTNKRIGCCIKLQHNNHMEMDKGKRPSICKVRTKKIYT